MTTKDSLTAQNVALKAQLDTLMAQVQALTEQAAAAPKKERKAAKPLVSRGYFKTRDELTDKWLDDTSRPCIIVSVPGAKPRKVTEANFAKELELHAKLVSAYKALA